MFGAHDTSKEWRPTVQMLATVRLAAVVLPILSVTAALADDDKTYPGAMCRVIAPTANLEDLTRNAVGLNTNGAMLNFSQGEQTWICPAVRNHMGSDPEFARITVQE